jgi:hypothetical protein
MVEKFGGAKCALETSGSGLASDRVGTNARESRWHSPWPTRSA